MSIHVLMRGNVDSAQSCYLVSDMALKARTAREWEQLLIHLEAAELSTASTANGAGTGVGSLGSNRSDDNQQTTNGRQARVFQTNRGPCEVMSFSDHQEVFNKPCIDCGRITGNFCDGVHGDCYAEDTNTVDKFQPGQRTPLCTVCEKHYTLCRVCRGSHGCTPPAWE